MNKLSKRIPKLFQYASDIHSEHKDYIIPFLRRRSDVLLLAGDIGNPFSSKYEKLLGKISNKFPLTFIVAGNHEYHFVEKRHEMKEVDDKILSICKSFGNIHFLQNSTYKVDNGLNILGSTLWTKVPSSYPQSFDNYRIWCNGKRFSRTDMNNLNTLSIEYIKKELIRCKKSKEELLILTHHPPSFNMQNFIYQGYIYPLRFYNTLDSLFAYPMVGWVCGHTHTKMVKIINGIPCAINAHGYRKENKNTFVSSRILRV